MRRRQTDGTMNEQQEMGMNNIIMERSRKNGAARFYFIVEFLTMTIL